MSSPCRFRRASIVDSSMEVFATRQAIEKEGLDGGLCEVLDRGDQSDSSPTPKHVRTPWTVLRRCLRRSIPPICTAGSGSVLPSFLIVRVIPGIMHGLSSEHEVL